VLLADEPTGNLDSTTSDEIMRVFGELADRGRTIVLVTHEPDIAAHARRLIRLKDGRVEEDLPVAASSLASLVPPAAHARAEAAAAAARP
jgi:putative ABC transport system ATP-binding protein